jgi:hypothetical protein
MELYKFPRTPHLVWLGPGQARDDKVLSDQERTIFLEGEIVVEEKVDGTNLGFSVTPEGRVRAQSRGAYLERGGHPQYDPLWAWLAPREHALAAVLGDDLLLFGEWCFATHTVHYDRLSDWFLGFDVYDRGRGRFWSSVRRDSLLGSLGISPVPICARGRFDLTALCDLLTGSISRVGSSSAEGFYLRREDDRWLLDRAKLVRAEFVQGIDKHWSRRPLVKNRLAAKKDVPPMSIEGAVVRSAT